MQQQLKRDLHRVLGAVGGIDDLPRSWLTRLKAQVLTWSSVRDGLPRIGLPQEVNEWREGNREHLLRGTLRLALAKELRLPHLHGGLGIRVFRNLGLYPDLERRIRTGERVSAREFLRYGIRQLDFGFASHRSITTAGVNFLEDVFENTAEAENFKFHAMGTGSTAENITDTVLVTEVETRATGSQGQGASANIYQTIGTITATTNRAIQEHGIFSASSAGTLWDRTVFTTINLANGDSIQFTYNLTLSAGG
jgi:hypothetical protein